MDPYTASGAYGFSGWTPATPGGVAIMAETYIGQSGDIPGAVLPKLPFSYHNPLFWLLVLALVWSGYVYGAFDVGFRKIGGGSIKIGK